MTIVGAETRERDTYDKLRLQDFQGKEKTDTPTVADLDLSIFATDPTQTITSLWDPTWRYLHKSTWRTANWEG
jgi:hypothetical protein